VPKPVADGVIIVRISLLLRILIQPRLFDVEQLAANRQDGLELAIAALLGRAASAIASTMYSSQNFGISFRAVSSLPGSPPPVSAPFTNSFASAAGCFASASGGEGFIHDATANGWILLQERHQAFVTMDETMPPPRRCQALVLVWPSNCGLGTLTLMNRRQAFAQIIAAERRILFLQ